jgi:hypothetical protein
MDVEQVKTRILGELEKSGETHVSSTVAHELFPVGSEFITWAKEHSLKLSVIMETEMYPEEKKLPPMFRLRRLE